LMRKHYCRNKEEQKNKCNKWWATTRGGAGMHCEYDSAK